MTPDIMLRKILTDVCLDRLPFLEIRENERPLWMKWEKRRSPKEIGFLRRKEKRVGRPLGPQGHWAWKKDESCTSWRPHSLDEAIIEWMCPAWMGHGLDPDYITVVSSGPFGGLYHIYRNERFLTMEMDVPFGDRIGMIKWLQRFLDSKASMEKGPEEFSSEMPHSSS